jgi:hypothetical protein
MGVLQQGTASSSSPVLLVNKKGGNTKRVVSDLRFLNKRIRKRNWPFPLVRDTVQRLGASQCKYLSTLDLKDAFHSLKLHKDSQRHAGITSYYGGKSYFYKRLPQGASLSPCEFQQYIQSVLDEIPNSNDYVIAHMDDLIIYSRSVENHFFHIQEILRTLEENGLKISPKKAQLFKSSLTYMGHVITIQHGQPYIKAMKDKCEAIRRLREPRNYKEVKSFIGAVNYLSMYLPNLQFLLVPLHKISSPRARFVWTSQCQENFERIRELLAKPPVLAMPSGSGVVRLYTDTSRTATGATLCQVIDGEERIIAYHSKTLPAAAARYSVTELEFFGLYLNVQAFQNFLKGVHFEVYIDHSAVVQILGSKNQPPTRRMQTLVERLNPYSFTAGYKKGKDMVICDLLSRMCAPEGEDPLGDPTPIACVLTRSGAKKQGITVPPATGKKMDFKSPESKASKAPATPVALPSAPVSSSTPMPRSNIKEGVQSEPSVIFGEGASSPLEPPPMRYSPVDISRELASSRREPPAPPRPRTLVEIGNRNVPDIPIAGRIPRLEPVTESHLDYDEVRYPVAAEPLFRENQPLLKNVDRDQITSQHVPKQKDIDKHMAEITKRCLRDFNIPLKQAELCREYKSSPTFGGVYEFLRTGLLPKNRSNAHSVMAAAEEYVMVHGMLFKFNLGKDGSELDLRLAVPESLAAYIISQYHDSLMACHQGIGRTFRTLNGKFYIPGLYNRIWGFIKSCEVCQQRKLQQERDNSHEYQQRIFQSYKPFSEIHTDIKHMFPSFDGFHYLLVATCVQTRFIVAVPLKKMDCTSVAEALLQRVVFIYGVPDRIVCDQGKSFANKVFEYLCSTLQIQNTFVSPENHGSLVAERSIQCISKLILSQLQGHGSTWPLYIQSACYAYNTFGHSRLDGLSPFEMVYGRPPPDHSKIAVGSSDHIPVTYADYVERLKIRFDTIGSTVLKLQNQEQEHRARQHESSKRRSTVYRPGQLVYFLMPSNSNLNTNTRKFVVSYIGPVKIKEVLDPNHVILEDLSGRLITGVHHVKRIKPAYIRSKSGAISTEEELRRELYESNTAEKPQSVSFVGSLISRLPAWFNSTDEPGNDGMPNEGESLFLNKSRFKDGELQVNFITEDEKWNDWFAVSECPDLDLRECDLSRIMGSRNKLLNFIAEV